MKRKHIATTAEARKIDESLIVQMSPRKRDNIYSLRNIRIYILRRRRCPPGQCKNKQQKQKKNIVIIWHCAEVKYGMSHYSRKKNTKSHKAKKEKRKKKQNLRPGYDGKSESIYFIILQRPTDPTETTHDATVHRGDRSYV